MICVRRWAERKETLAELFDGRSQLVVYHFMFGPDWAEGCQSCSLLADHFDGECAALECARCDALVVVCAGAAGTNPDVQEADGLELRGSPPMDSLILTLSKVFHQGGKGQR